MLQSKENAKLLRYLKLRDKCAALIQAGLVTHDGVPATVVISPDTVLLDDIQAMDAYTIAGLVLDLGAGHFCTRTYMRHAARLVAAQLSTVGLTSDRVALEQTIKDAYRGAGCLFRERRRLDRKEHGND